MSSVAASAESIDSRCLNLSRPRSSSPTPVPHPMRHTGSSSPPCRLLCDRRLHIDLQRPLTHDREVDDSTDDHLRPEPLLHASTQACPQETPSSGLFISKEGQERSFTEKDMLFNATGPPQAWPGRAVAQLGRKSWDGPKPISFVGSTGSIGTQTLDIVAENPDKF